MQLADGEPGHLFQNHVPSISNADMLLRKDWPFSNLAIVKKKHISNINDGVSCKML